ncbi:hypothetical protein SEA_ZOOMAN_306 [Microbacterium phage Zooman]|nr:hypothetical protein SEA_ZOOMAN_306 [Microbacterium phage Zooman]
MTDFRVGDKVQAFSKTTQDTAVFTVTGVERDYDNSFALVGKGFKLQDSHFEFELMERPFQLPTTPGLYGFPNGGSMKMLLTSHGEWYWVDFSAHGHRDVIRGGEKIDEKDVRNQLEHSVVELEYEYTGRR